ncbi:MAG TPA: C40 family peptidase [Planococcus sp. (in: firmicutes)]|nr:C40 family peptidase [Planococcus sp. (in: firmicutes)]
MLQTASTSWVCAVPVATVWTSPDKVRDIDAHGIDRNANINKWLETMDEQDSHDLVKSNRIQTQILYGEPVVIEEVKDGWARIIAVWQPSAKDQRGYPGWVPMEQLTEMETVDEDRYARVTVSKAQLWTEDFKPFSVAPFNALLPVKVEGEFIRVQTPEGTALIKKDQVELADGFDKMPQRSGTEIVNLATQFLELQYLWGGMSSYGFDCSGFSYNMMKASGYQIPRDAVDQALAGEEVEGDFRVNWKPGDLLFFAYEEGKGRLHHVGIYYGNGLMIHSPTPGSAIEIIELAGTVHEKELCAVRRIAAEVEGAG